MGVQTFDTKIRQSVGRISSQDELIKGLENLAAYDEASVVIDLIFDLPGQPLASWRNERGSAFLSERTAWERQCFRVLFSGLKN